MPTNTPHRRKLWTDLTSAAGSDVRSSQRYHEGCQVKGSWWLASSFATADSLERFHSSALKSLASERLCTAPDLPRPSCIHQISSLRISAANGLACISPLISLTFASRSRSLNLSLNNGHVLGADAACETTDVIEIRGKIGKSEGETAALAKSFPRDEEEEKPRDRCY